MKIIKTFCFLLILVMIPVLSACNGNASTGDELTMYVGLGNTNGDYYQKIRDAVLEETGIEIKLIFNNTLDTTTAMKNRIANYDLPADIMITASSTNAEAQKTSFLDLASYTNIPDLFTVTKQQEVAVDGAIYQLPFSSRLIGIEYNKTLLEEMGWELPRNYQDMVVLKAKADKAEIPFAVSCGVATGHGFNYLFHLMGSQYLTSPNGNEWFDEFINGDTSVDKFAAESAYFEKYVQAGLFGKIHDEDWQANTEFSRTRALFYYNILNDIYTYDGFQYNEDGTIVGAEYNKDGTPVAEKDPEGEAVFFEDEYVYYDADNEEMRDLERYHIPGAVILHDEYGSMPWISENGESDCFTVYDNMHIALDKKLGEKGQEEKLKQAVKVLEFMTSEAATNLFSEIYPDGFVSTNDYNINESRLYAQYKERIKNGYLMPWYYNSFDNNTIVNVGQEANDFLKHKDGVSLDSIMNTLETSRKAFLTDTEKSIANVEETLDYADTAKLEAIANGLSAQKALKEEGIETKVDAALMPYINDLADLPINISLGVVQEKIYVGELYPSGIQAYVNDHNNHPVVIEMTGAELQEIIDNGYSIKADYEFDITFPYTYVLKDDEEIQADKTYNVAVSPESLENSIYQQFLNGNKVILKDNEPISGTTVEGITLFTDYSKKISPSTLLWK